jgi:hypothetical protein
MREMRNALKSENLNVRDHLADIGIDRKIRLKRILKMWGVRKWSHLAADSEGWPR